ncbi:hypothetical protein DCAR_0102894 [Daucus carota subsp. sativus]|uniref:Fe2OG dioxygenase domain-containing protein n=1 Tax=Daucus carota subsp. sativus TaxID=79200 RepID=A0A162B527_DAUCS|nr:hypothetical protein DCAR_0102894 [Daucus carota subsp. sativus]
MSPAAGGGLPGMTSDSFAKDAIISWFRGEFAAANAMIDALCGHLTEIGGDGKEYEAAFAAIHRRRLNWIPILQMQKFYSIADVANELKAVAAAKKERAMEVAAVEESVKEVDGGEEVADVESGRSDESPKSEITDTGSHEVQHMLPNIEICSDHENCEARRAQINMTKGFVNVVRGLKLYDEIFTETELSKLTDYVNELRIAGQNGELSGETFIMYNQAKQQVKGGNKRELIQLGAPIFGPIKEDATNHCPKSNIEPIPATLQGVIDHLVLWHLISENRKPNSCIINFFDEGEFSQPFLKPPHIDQPISTLLLSESEMAFGRTLVCDNDGNYKGSLMLSLKEGSLLVMRGNSADVARHVMCTSPSKRISITFFRVRTQTHESISTAVAPMTGAMTLWQPGVPNSYALSNGARNGYEEMDMIPKWGVLRSPMVMLAPVRPMVLGPKRMSRGGTGVFLPWNASGTRKHTKHLPPRAQKGRFLALPPPVETHKPEVTADSEMISIEGK